MATSKRFVAKNGLDNNSNTIINVGDPVNAQDVATKAFSSNASNLTSGTVTTARLGTGTADSTTFLRGDGSWQIVSTGIWTIKTSTYTAVSGDMILADSTSAAFTITLPASPVAGNQVIVADAGGTFNTKNVTVGRNGSNILGLAQDLVLNVANEKVTLVYYNATRGWILA